MAQNSSEDWQEVAYFEDFVDPFEICSSSVFIVLLIPTIYIFMSISVNHFRKGFPSTFHKLFFVSMSNVSLLKYKL